LTAESDKSNKSNLQSEADALTEPHTIEHAPKVLNDVLQEVDLSSPALKKRYHHPLYVDGLLAFGLLLAMGGFTIGLVKIYITHTAKQYISQRHYLEAINMLAGAPMPGWFMVAGENPEELLNEARYLDAMDKLDSDNNDEAAIKQLEKIRPGSRFYEMSNDILKDHAKPSEVTLNGVAEHLATPAEARSREDEPLIPVDKSEVRNQ
jgi:hypothetical protein